MDEQAGAGKALVAHYRKTPLKGFYVDLVPVTYEDVPDMVRLRNTERSRTCFYQLYNLTEAGQRAWLDRYFQRDNDLYWTIRDKKGEFLGLVRAYDMDFSTGYVEAGSLIVRADRAKERPYTLEANILLLELLYDTFGFPSTVGRMQTANVQSRAFNKHMGAWEGARYYLNGGEFLMVYNSPATYQRQALHALLDRWILRDTKETGGKGN